MAALGTVLSVAQTLLAALQCSELKEMCSILGYKSQLEELSKTVATIRAVFLDAESKQDELNHEAQLWIQELKDAVYDADDLLDEFLTLAHQKELLMEGGKISEKVRDFFSDNNPLAVAYKMSQGVKKIRKKLDAIASNHTQFGLSIDYQPIRRRREETCSYVYADNIVGREADTEEIIGMLFDPNVQQDVSFLTIVGVGGLGKTTLAQLVYNDKRVEKGFDLRLWTCVSDHDQRQLDVKGILRKILGSTTVQKTADDSELELVQSQLREKLVGKKYLLFLDDVWNENRDEWVKLAEFFMGGRRGSWVVVTTRSMETARVVGDGRTYKLKGLSEENSWHLFERTAFEEVGEQANSSDLVAFGHEIVQRCANNPLAIRVAGSLLYGQDQNKWRAFLENGFAKIRHGENGILPILKLSYDHLESPLKICFTYCALFPKDSVVHKKKLISFWMAQGYIKPLDAGQSIEDAGEEYFSILLRRCFFQDVRKDIYGGIKSCKMHDLMHDIAQDVAGKEICVTNSITYNLDEKIRHFYLLDNIGSHLPKTNVLTKSKVRSFLRLGRFRPLNLENFLSNYSCLRALDLKSSNIKTLPGAIIKLMHLRYLDLSRNFYLEELPESITKLYNLQTLNLKLCMELKQLPKDLSKLVELRVLDISNCLKLTCMPWGMGKLSHLHKLTMFVVGEVISSSKRCVAGKLEDLKALKNLKGNLKVSIMKNAIYVKENGEGGGYLRDMQHLRSLEIEWRRKVEFEEAMLEDMHPHPSLKELELVGYSGVRMPSWAGDDKLGTFLPNLVRIRISGCDELKYLPSFGKRRHLKSLEVEYLSNLECMESNSNSSNSDEAGFASQVSLFPCLEILVLNNLPKLKGWWGDDQAVGNSNSSSRQPHQWPLFPCLSKMTIKFCRKLSCISVSPSLEEVELYGLDKRLQLITINMGSGDWDWDKKGQVEVATSSSSSSLSCPGQRHSIHPKLRNVIISNVGYLKKLPMEAFQCLADMELGLDEEVESLSEEVGEVFRVCSSTLKSLSIESCDKLSRLCGGGGGGRGELDNDDDDDDDDGMPWRSLHQSLLNLNLRHLPKLVELPKGMRYLTSLQSLVIGHCSNLESLPEWIGCLSSLRSLTISDCKGVESLPKSMRKLTCLRQLEIYGCSESLKERCRNPTGEDWPYIQHIPRVFVIRFRK